MTRIVVTGLSHHTAPVELRERLAVPDPQLDAVLGTLRARHALDEVLVVSTCNRVEVYATVRDPRAIEGVRSFFAERAGEDDLTSALYVHQDDQAVRHAFRVAASLDSLVVGEPQILGQLKGAYDAASRAGTVGTLLGRCFTRAFAVAKRVRSETTIAEGSVSISSVAVELARKIFGDLQGRRALLLGAGEMGEAAAHKLSQLGARLTVINRSPEKATALADSCGGEARGYEELTAELISADVVVTSTSSERFILTHETMDGVVRARRHRPLFLIDIAVPRDVDPRVGALDNVFLYDVDDLEKVAQQNLEARRSEAAMAEGIVDLEVGEVASWMRSLELTPTIVALRERFDAILEEELARTLGKMEGLSDKEKQALVKMRGAMVNKLLHQPLTQLKRGQGDPEGPALISATRRLFGLDELPPGEERAAGGASVPHPHGTALAAAGRRNGESQ